MTSSATGWWKAGGGRDSNNESSVALHPGRFDTTHWSVVLRAGGEDASPQGAEALERLYRTYWPPLHAFIRRRGYSNEDAEDLTQKFFSRLLEKRDLTGIEPRKGKFRTFLLTALTHFLANERDYARAAKRGGGKQIISLDEDRTAHLQESELASQQTPDKVFDTRWAMTVLEVALGKLKEEMGKQGKGSQFEVLRVYLTDEPAEGQYAQTGAQLEMTSQAVAVAVHRLRQRYRELVRGEVAQTVATPLDLEQEMRHLFEALIQ
jgi:RNA polymerase sigma-70 factor (ECF subfamily)